MNIIPQHATDFYKTGHIFQYPEGTEYVYANFTARHAGHAKVSSFFDNKTVFFGLQAFVQWFLIDLWNEKFFKQPKDKVVNAYKRRMDNALGKDSVPVEHVAALHDLGYLPIHIKALPEGSRVNIKVPYLTIANTNADFFWVTNYVETVLSDELWLPITSATTAYEYKRTLDHYVKLTGSDPMFAAWQNHDFSMRGMGSVYDAAKSGAAHLLCNFGTDTIPAIDFLEDYYGADSDKELIGGSVPATEHSVMCMGGKVDEKETFRRLIQDVYPSGIVSIVSDTWDFWHVITVTAAELKQEIMFREKNALGQAKVVFRPDSGDPVDIICGTAPVVKELNDDAAHLAIRYRSGGVVQLGKNYFKYSVVNQGRDIEWDQAEPKPEHKGAVQCLWEIFGGTTTDKDFKTLNQCVGLIYGDSITLERQEQILKRLMEKGFSAGNIVFGVGSYTYQHVTRDTFGMAMKATFGTVNGEDRELFKDPATDVGGVKKSAKGLLRVLNDGESGFILEDQVTQFQSATGALDTVFYNGHLVKFQTLAEIRAVLANS